MSPVLSSPPKNKMKCPNNGGPRLGTCVVPFNTDVHLCVSEWAGRCPAEVTTSWPKVPLQQDRATSPPPPCPGLLHRLFLTCVFHAGPAHAESSCREGKGQSGSGADLHPQLSRSSWASGHGFCPAAWHLGKQVRSAGWTAAFSLAFSL